MSKIITLPGFPNQIGEPIDVPDLAYLLTIPMFDQAPLSYVRERCSSFQRELLKRAPIVGDRKNILVTCRIQYLKPEYSGTVNKHGNTYEWHMDGSGDIYDRYNPAFNGDRFHSFVSDCTGSTEFNALPLEIDITERNNIELINNYFNGELRNVLQAQRAPTCRFVTFSNHIHRPSNPLKDEFRFFFHVTESDYMPPVRREKWNTDCSIVFKEDKVYKSIEKKDGCLIIHHEPNELIQGAFRRYEVET